MGANNASQELQLLDLSYISGRYEEVEDSAFEKLAQDFGQAMNNIGFVYLINHGIDMSKIDKINKLSKEFYNLPTSIKHKYRKTNPINDYFGYGGPGDQSLDPTKGTELREFFDYWGPKKYNEEAYPREIPGLKDALFFAQWECNNLAKKLFRGLGKYLKLADEHYIVKAHSHMDDGKDERIPPVTQFRTAHYYQLEEINGEVERDLNIRCGKHTDWGSLTFLFQDDVGGLEVKKRDGNWIDALPIKNSILINGGNLLELWSAGIFKADYHRVISLKKDGMKNKARQSLIYFLTPNDDFVVEPLVGCPPGDEEYLKRGPILTSQYYMALLAASNTY